MTLVVCDLSTSLDGHVTGPPDSTKKPSGDGADGLYDWLSDTATRTAGTRAQLGDAAAGPRLAGERLSGVPGNGGAGPSAPGVGCITRPRGRSAGRSQQRARR